MTLGVTFDSGTDVAQTSSPPLGGVSESVFTAPAHHPLPPGHASGGSPRAPHGSHGLERSGSPNVAWLEWPVVPGVAV